MLEYASDLFEASSVEALAERLVRLLEAAVADPGRAIGSLELLAPAERHTILREWNDTARAVAPATLPQLFAAQAAEDPACDRGGVRGSEPELWRARCALEPAGASSARAGVGPEVVVGLCVERSLEMLVGLLGILKAGGAYLPLDPAYPAERLAFMLDDARAPVLLTHSALRAQLPDTTPASSASMPMAGAIAATAHHRTGQLHSTRTTPPMSSTPRAQRERPRASPLRTRTSCGCSAPPNICSASAHMTFGRCSIPSLSTSRSGRFGARFCMAGDWSSFPIRSAAHRRNS